MSESSTVVASAGLQRLTQNVSDVLAGRRAAAEIILATFLARGHLLMQDVPGVGKTTTAKALAASVDGSWGRIQFTPDLLPSDLTGVTIYRQETSTFEFHPGPLFHTIVIGDEINRASPKTQSALLECMAERQVTVDGSTHGLPDPFMVIATQNPVEMDGTYRLPEAQRDRFMARLSLGYPPLEEERTILAGGGFRDPLATIEPVMSLDEVHASGRAVERVHCSEAVIDYILRLVRATREQPSLSLGLSPRAGLHMVRLTKAFAYLRQREHVLPDDVQQLAQSAWAHRLLVTRSSRVEGVAAQEVLRHVLDEVPLGS